MIDASDLTEWVGLFLPTLQPDGGGGFIETTPPNVEEDRPAAQQYASGRSRFDNSQTADYTELLFWIRYEPGITSKYRLSWRSQYLDILNVENFEASDTWLKLTAAKREAGAQ